MNVSPVSINYVNHSNNYKSKLNQNVSFCGGKTAFAEKAADKVGCAGSVLLLIALSPLLLIGKLFGNNKNNKIDSLTNRIQGEYERHCGSYDFFQEDIDEMNAFLDKHSKHAEYSEFVKDALEFLRSDFALHKGCCDQNARLEAFENGNGNLEWLKFMNTINESAKAAVSKNGKGIDREKLDKNIQFARDLIQDVYAARFE